MDLDVVLITIRTIAQWKAVETEKATEMYKGAVAICEIDPHPTPTTELADLIIPCSITGIEKDATTYRMDAVPLKLRKVLDPPEGIYSDVEILKMILQKVRRKKKHGLAT